MKTIKVFIASSDELHLERLEFTDMIMQLNRVFKTRGFEIEPVKWEWHDASMNRERKQTEYNNALKQCELCLVLYWNKKGEYTEEELNTAYNELKSGNNPRKLYVYFKEPAENITDELRDFKTSFATQYGHFYCKFENVDTFRLNFLLQFEQYYSPINSSESIEINNSNILFGGKQFVDFKNVPFAGKNPDYVRILNSINILQKEITTLESILRTSPNSQLEELIINKINDKERLNDELEVMECSLLDTAKLIVKLSYGSSSIRLRKAIELFEKGDNKGANAILDFNDISYEMSENAKRIDYALKIKKDAQEIENNARDALLSNIKECKFKVKTITTSKYKSWLDDCDKIYSEAIIQAKGRVEDNVLRELESDALLLILQNMNIDIEDINDGYLYFMDNNRRNLNNYDGRKTFFVFIKDTLRKYNAKKKQRNHPIFKPIDIINALFSSEVEDEIDKMEIVKMALSYLSERNADIMRELLIEGKSPECIAKEQNVHINVIYTIKARGVQKMQATIKKILLSNNY